MPCQACDETAGDEPPRMPREYISFQDEGGKVNGPPALVAMQPNLENMNTWTDRTGHS